MSLLLDFHTLPGSSEPPPYAASNRAQPQSNLGLPSSIADAPHRFYPMPSRMTQEPNSLFSPESESTAASSVHALPFSPPSGSAQQQTITEPLTAATTNESLLPSYTTGAEIRPNINPQNAQSDTLTSALKVQINNEPSNGQSYDVGDIIQGTIMFAPWKKGDKDKQEISSVMVVLQGVEVSMANGGLGNNRTFRLAFHLVPDLAMPPDGTVSVGYIYSFPFSVQIPELRQTEETPEPDCPCHCKDSEGQPLHRTLPPTFPGGNVDSLNNNGATIETAHIRYQLCAMVRGPLYNSVTHETKTTTVCKSIQDIQVTPSYTTYPASAVDQATPPVMGEVEVRPRQGLFKASRKSASGTLHIQMSGQPINLAVDQAYSALIPLDLTFMGSSSSSAMPTISRISLDLVARTSYTTSRRYMSLQDARVSKPSVVKTGFERIPLSHVDMVSSCEWTTREDGSSKATINVPLTWEPTLSISPSFESCTIEREYKFSASVHVQGAKLPVRVQVPAHIVASFRPKSLVLA